MAADGAGDVLVAALRRHGGESAAIAEAACGALRNLAADPSLAPGLGALGALGAVLNALRAWPDAPEVAEAGNSAADNLLASPETALAALTAEGAGDASVAEAAIRALAGHARVTDARGRVALRAAGLDARLARAVASHGRVPSIAKLAAAAVAALDGR